MPPNAGKLTWLKASERLAGRPGRPPASARSDSYTDDRSKAQMRELRHGAQHRRPRRALERDAPQARDLGLAGVRRPGAPASGARSGRKTLEGADSGVGESGRAARRSGKRRPSTPTSWCWCRARARKATDPLLPRRGRRRPAAPRGGATHAGVREPLRAAQPGPDLRRRALGAASLPAPRRRQPGRRARRPGARRGRRGAGRPPRLQRSASSATRASTSSSRQRSATTSARHWSPRFRSR